jgi:hypothetical protein
MWNLIMTVCKANNYEFLCKKVFFSGLFANDVLVQLHISTGLPSITIVGLASKSVAESKERARAALSNMGLALPLRYTLYAIIFVKFCRLITRLLS